MPKCNKVEVPDLPPPKPYQNYRASIVAKYTGLSERLILDRCAAGEIQHVRHGRRAVTIPGTEIVRLNTVRS